jgi:biopolymer transport protein ExbB
MRNFLPVAVFVACLSAAAVSAQDPPGVEAQTAVPRFDAPSPKNSAEFKPFVDFRDPVGLMRLGGYLMWPILFCSVLALTFGIERLVSLRRGRILPGRFLNELSRDLDEGRLDREKAVWRCRSNGSPAALVLLNAFRHWGRPMTEIELAINEGGQREVAPLRRNLRALQGAANLATLLGLLGTVIGMILAFNEVAVTSGQPRSETLASGIAQALLTTAFGLLVAIPALFMHSYFSGRVERMVYELDQTALLFAERICAENIAERGAADPASPAQVADTAPSSAPLPRVKRSKS